MKDVFEAIDNWNGKLNVLRNHVYMRKVVLYFSVAMIPVWFYLGWDSGIGIIEEAVKALPKLLTAQITFFEWKDTAYSVYGQTFHFSAFVIYGLLYCGLSAHLEQLDITKSKNVFYSAFLVLFNISVFEHFFMCGYNHYHHHFGLVQWYMREFFFLQQFLWLLVLGAFTLLALYVDSFKLNDKKVVGRNFTFKINMKMFIVAGLCVASIIFWIYYPFKVETITLGNWTSSTMFPQTHYYSIYKGVYYSFYVQNDLVHLVNTVTKAMFAITQLYVISRFRKIEDV